MEFHAHLLHVGNTDLGQVAVQHGQHMIQCFDDSDLGAERSVSTRQFQTDDASADDDHALGELFQAQRAGGVDAVGIFLQAGDGGLGVNRASSHDDSISSHLFGGAVCLLDRELARCHKLGFAVDLCDLVCLEQASDTAGQLLGDGILMCDDLGEVDGDIVHFHADVLALMLDVLNQLCAVQQALGGDAAHVQAGAAQVLLFDDSDLCAQLSQTDGSHIAARAAADDDHTLVAGRLCRCRSSCGRCGRCCGSSAAYLFARLADVAQQALDGDILVLLCHDLQQHTVMLADHFVGQLIGGDLQDGFASLHGIAFLFQPLRDGAFFHGQPQLGHGNFKSHRFALLRAEYSAGSAAGRADP